MERNLGEWQRMNVFYEIHRIDKIFKKFKKEHENFKVKSHTKPMAMQQTKFFKI
jgi:hypothetical protein